MRLSSIPIHRIRERGIKTPEDYDIFFGSWHQGVCIIDRAGIVQYVNPAYGQIFRQSRAAIIHSNVYNHLDDELAIDALKRKKHVEGFLQMHIGDRKIYAEASPMLDEGEFCGVLIKYEDRSEKSNQVVDISGLFKAAEKRRQENPFPEIVTQDEKFIGVLNMASKAAKTNATIMIQGESGTGKELVARAIHKYSKRSAGPFVAVNCGAIPANLIESELFGYEAGAFTGAARQKKGKFELAHGGTLFLDEIGDLPLELQVKLLRALQEREIERVGGMQTIPVDVRILTATHCHLEEMVEEGNFREDLFYRLNVVPIELPSLRERTVDFPLLVNHFSNISANNFGIEQPVMTSEAMEYLQSYEWPGNIRELENVMERVMIFVDDGYIDVKDLPRNISKHYTMKKISQPSAGLVNLSAFNDVASFDSYEREIIELALKKHGSFNAAGKALGLTHKTVAAKARKYGLRD